MSGTGTLPTPAQPREPQDAAGLTCGKGDNPPKPSRPGLRRALLTSPSGLLGADLVKKIGESAP
jgi:hypothetical protein